MVSDKSNVYPKHFAKFIPNLLHAVSMPAFFLLCVLLYQPKALEDLMHTAEGMRDISNIWSFNIAICCAIILVCMVLMRLLFWALRKKMFMDLGRYSLWCIGETFVTSAFVALYLTLMDTGRDGYFYFLGPTFGIFVAIFVFPYMLLGLWYYYANALTIDRSSFDSMRLKFYDSRRLLKFVTPAESILYIESNENYIIIHYHENGVMKRYQLRNSMKSVEPLCEKAGFARVHRCYIINPTHVKQIRKEEGGQYFAVLEYLSDNNGIPVSKKYHSNIIALL